SPPPMLPDSTHTHKNVNDVPTRRSSDLIAIVMSKIANGARSAGGGCTIAAAIGVGYLSARLFSVKKKRAVSAWAVGTLGPALRLDRKSTSELQSRFDLVCRLLLEKKKK